jgi:hypothetical protein
VGGAADGSIHIWRNKKLINRCDLVIRPAHHSATAVSSVNIIQPSFIFDDESLPGTS